MHIQVEPGEASWAEVGPLDDLVYPPEVAATLSWRDVTWAHAEQRVMLRDESGALRAHVGLYYRDARLDGAPVRLGGIGGVITHPEWRRQGLATAAMRRAAELFAARGDIDFALLVCEPKNVAFYRGLGWQSFAGELRVEQPKGQISFTVMGTMLLGVNRVPPLSGIIDLCGLPW